MLYAQKTIELVVVAAAAAAAAVVVEEVGLDEQSFVAHQRSSLLVEVLLRIEFLGPRNWVDLDAGAMRSTEIFQRKYVSKSDSTILVSFFCSLVLCVVIILFSLIERQTCFSPGPEDCMGLYIRSH